MSAYIPSMKKLEKIETPPDPPYEGHTQCRKIKLIFPNYFDRLFVNKKSYHDNIASLKI